MPRLLCWDGDMARLREYLDGFEVAPESSEVWAWIEANGLDCFDANAERRRYVYVTFTGPMWPQASVEEAVEAYRENAALQREATGDFSFGEPLGFVNFGWPLVVESPADELVVVAESVSVIDGVVRGLVLNHSERLWARDVVVTATDAAGAVGVWRFALAVQPGEPAPFEIEGWAGVREPSEISFEVSADLSPRIDLSRSLRLHWHQTAATRGLLLGTYTDKMAVGEIPEGLFGLTTADIIAEAPTSHPRLAEDAAKPAIDHLKVYAALYHHGVVQDVFEVTPLADPWTSLLPEWIEINSIPEVLPDGKRLMLPTVGVIGASPMIWAGGAAPAS